VHALYGLKSSGAAWRAHFAQTLSELGLKSSLADPDVWMKPAVKADGTKYYEYILVYMDDQLSISENPKWITYALQRKPWEYKLKGVKPPDLYLTFFSRRVLTLPASKKLFSSTAATGNPRRLPSKSHGDHDNFDSRR